MRPALGLAAAVVIAVAAVLLLSAGGGDGPATTATIGIHYSQFLQTDVTVPAGSPVTFTLENQDPIEHEWIVGDESVHERHRTGTEPFHASIPTEVTLPAFTTRVTTVTFEEPGDYRFVCHLPGHEQYGMVGTVHVVED